MSASRLTRHLSSSNRFWLGVFMIGLVFESVLVASFFTPAIPGYVFVPSGVVAMVAIALGMNNMGKFKPVRTR
jgi:hypothetical protein